MDKQIILKKVYNSINKMNNYLIQGDSENAIRERVHQQLLRKKLEIINERPKKSR